MASSLSQIYSFGLKHDRFASKQHEHWKELLESGHGPNEDWSATYHGPRRSSPLFSAVLENEVGLSRLLLRHGAGIERRNGAGRTALQEAIALSHDEIVELFLDHGTDLEVRVASGRLEGGTALHVAVAGSRVAVVESLLRRGANPLAGLRDGWTAVDLAVLDRQETVLASLLKHVAVRDIARHDSDLDETSDDSADGDTPAIVARHLIEYGIRSTTGKYRNWFLRCLARVIRNQDFRDAGRAQIAKVLVQETEGVLMKMAGSPGVLKWPRNLCSQCERFQSQDSHTSFKTFKHSPDFDALLLSAQGGCTLCHFIVDFLNHRCCFIPQVDKKWRAEFGITPEVRLRLECKVGTLTTLLGEYQMIIVAGEKIAFVDLDHVQKHINDAVAEAGPDDTEGTGSNRSLAIAKAWLQRCVEEHPSCYLAARRGLPNRVIDVGDASTSPRIYLSKRENEFYTTLSYHSGEDRSFCSLTTNIDAHTRGISLDDFPKTIRDAVIITRNLGIRYMWVSALCILQDSEEDLKRELPLMGEIYANSSLTVAAEYSMDCSDGCFRKRTWRNSAIYPLDIRLSSGIQDQESRVHGRTKNSHTSTMNRLMALPRHSQWPRDKERANLETRGWALQESLLSRRTLHCGKNQLSWSCLEAKCSEITPEEDDTRSTSDWNHTVKRVLGTGFEGYGNLNRLSAEKLFDFWLDIVADFSRRTLSKPTDKLLAISGLQDAIAELIKDAPVAGMWQNRCFVPSLLWQVARDDPNATGVAYRCPSWSWASVPMPVVYRTKPQHGMVNENQWYHETHYLLNAVSWNVEADSRLDAIGGYVTLRCKIFPEIILSPKSKEGGHFETADDSTAAGSATDVWLMLVQTVQFIPALRDRGRSYDIYTTMLRLQRIHNSQMDFRRIGLATAKSATVKWHDRAREELIRLF